jgi:uncharacterized protein with GYD domain
MTSLGEHLTAALAGRYRIDRELGAGGMATVYLAEDVRHHRKVALKVLHPERAFDAEPFHSQSTNEDTMPRYLIEGSYTDDGTKGLVQEGGSRRRDTVAKMMEGMGGTLEAFYYTFGNRDVIAIYSAPDDVSALALSMAVNQSGKVTVTTHPLLSVEDVDRAAKKSVGYRPPGA